MQTFSFSRKEAAYLHGHSVVLTIPDEVADEARWYALRQETERYLLRRDTFRTLGWERSDFALSEVSPSGTYTAIVAPVVSLDWLTHEVGHDEATLRHCLMNDGNAPPCSVDRRTWVSHWTKVVTARRHRRSNG